MTFANQVGDVDVIADIVWLYESPGNGDSFHGLTPARLLDPVCTTLGGWASSKLVAGDGNVRTLSVTGSGGVPADATVVVLNLTATNSTANSFLSRCGRPYRC